MPINIEEVTCLSLHQPWASLLVYGIKRIEGRTWDCHHRGRLWIHAAGKAVDPADVERLHAFYTRIHGLDGQVPVFPPAYPTGVLLGCVEVADVVPSAVVEGWPGLPESVRLEAGSPFCFLCQNPRRLVLPQPLRGQQRLWQLPSAALKVALQGLREPPGRAPFAWRNFGDPRVMLAPPSETMTAAVTGKPQTASKWKLPPGQPQGSEQQQQQQQRDSRSIARGGGVATAAAASEGGSASTTVYGVGDGDGDEANGDDGVDLARRLRAVRKKLRQVSELEAALQSGAVLSSEQAGKLARMAEWRREVRQLEELALAGAGLLSGRTDTA